MVKISLNAQEKEEIVLAIADGTTIARACELYAISKYYLMAQCDIDPLFGKNFKKAREIAADCEAEALSSMDLDSCETPTQVAAKKLRADNTKWKASKLARETYGEKMEVSVHNTLDISKALESAHKRIRPILENDDENLQIALDVSPANSSAYDDFANGLKPVAELQPTPLINPDDADDLF